LTPEQQGLQAQLKKAQRHHDVDYNKGQSYKSYAEALIIGTQAIATSTKNENRESKQSKVMEFVIEDKDTEWLKGHMWGKHMIESKSPFCRKGFA
ncbi:hypothetical protein Ancab_016922, partial [Ancistrocladus abbreviatus]